MSDAETGALAGERWTASEEKRAEIDLDLDELIGLMEAVDWPAVPTISAAEAAAWNARLQEAREAVLDGGRHE